MKLKLATTALVLATTAFGPTVFAQDAPAHKPDRPFELHALTPEFWKLLDRNAKLETMGSGMGFTEGPVWDPSGFVWVSDEAANQIIKLYPDGHKENMVALIDPDGSTYDNDHRLLSTASALRSVIRLAPDGKSFETVVDHYQGKSLNTPNDLVIGPDGALYFTDPLIDMQKGAVSELPASVYRLGKDNQLTLLTTEMTACNGLAFSPDGKYLYIDDDKTRKIRRYNFDRKTGLLSNGTDFADMTDPDHHGVPDGIKVDRKGNLFVSGPAGVWVFNRKGTHIGTVQLPQNMANLTWGGPGYSKLYITASGSVYVLQTKTVGTLGYRH